MSRKRKKCCFFVGKLGENGRWGGGGVMKKEENLAGGGVVRGNRGVAVVEVLSYHDL